MTARQLERLLDLLLVLSEETPDGSLRDAIACVRSACWDLLEEER